MKTENKPPEYERHESYGLLQIGRSHGGSRNLFGSSVTHHTVIRLRICRGRIKRDSSNDWYGDDGEIVEVEMSPVQWAEAITSMNYGVGTPCTILHVETKEMEKCPERSERTLIEEEFRERMRRLADDLEQGLGQARELLAKKSLTKSDRQVILDSFDKLRREVSANFPFVQSQFNEAMESVVAEAKGEIEAFYTMVATRAGMQTSSPEIPALEDKSRE